MLLGLILTPDAYSKIPNSEEYIWPQYPGPFRLVVDPTNPSAKYIRSQITSTKRETDEPNITFTHVDITQQKATHDENMILYLECQAVECSLRVQLIEAIDYFYLGALPNSNTNMIYESCPSIMDHLMKIYGQVTLEYMHDKEQALISMAYDQKTPVDTVFGAINKFCVKKHA